MSRKDNQEKHIKRMADLLRQGATLTDLACPACSSPLFKLESNDIWCAKCEKKVIILKQGEEPTKITDSMVLDTLETTLLAKAKEIQNKMQQMENIEELHKLGAALSQLLENIEKIKKVKKI